jgi:predicted O-methyltransferase YrrM
MQDDPEKLLRAYVRPGMHVFEPGPGMGFFTMPLARLVDDAGQVVAVELQPRMVRTLKARLARENLLSRVDVRTSSAESGIQDLSGQIDFTLAFAVVHELPGVSGFFQNAARLSRPGTSLLLAEPAGHVNDAFRQSELEQARAAGFRVVDNPSIKRSRTALLQLA